ncbi:MAG TPA: DUF151 domain-containing protein [Treponema sp.]|nr:DUF151 domain-containing protein [Treponema sp.]HPC70635.1 DUF151 domain-containing protein [Treponema sp.]HRS03089.1 DUF151 domain-containing protein [Treponema sp.]HRU27883.1 DUF151 domain-containing protein [Treponema sp.]
MMKPQNRAHVVAILYDEMQDTPLALLQIDGKDAFISMPVGAFEASSIIMASEDLVTPQPLIHDVLIQLLKEHSFNAEYVELWGSPISGYYGRFRYQSRFFHRYLTIGPADCLVLALRLHVPIYIDPDMAMHAKSELPKDLVFDSANTQILYLDTHQLAQSV